MEENCYLNFKFECKGKKEALTIATSKRIENIIRCSEIYKDCIHEKLQSEYEANKDLRLFVHRTCVDTYVHPKNIQKVLKRQADDDEKTEKTNLPKRAQRSATPKFVFLNHCIFCGEYCEVEKDPKHPSRWREAYVCRQVEKSSLKKTFKQTILDRCVERNDEWSHQVQVRIGGAISDLHAADARYHVDCRTHFFLKPVSAAERNTQEAGCEQDDAFLAVTDVLKKDLSRIWNSIDIYTLYIDNGGTVLSRRKLIAALSDYFGEDLLVLSSPGIATIITFQSMAAKFLRVVPDADDDDIENALNKVKKQILHDMKDPKPDKNFYDIRLNQENASRHVSATVLDLLARISSELDNTLPALLIGNIIASVVTNAAMPPQISLAVLLRDSKELIQHMHEFGVTCSYDELLRFKKSAAVAASKHAELCGISDSTDGLVQVVVDNFDADISSQNGKLSTHSLAVLVTQPENKRGSIEEKIPRLKKSQMGDQVKYELEIMRYNGPKKPGMPVQESKKQVLPLKILASMSVTQQRANETDFNFLVDVLTVDNCPEFNGYNTRLSRQQGHYCGPKTNAVYLPLIDMPPADPKTVMTAMSKAQKLTENTGQTFTVFTADQQIYRVAVEVQWVYPDLFQTLVPRLGGMHMLMSFVGAVGSLMVETGLSEILGSVFGGVHKMLKGKKFPMNMRALRLLTELLLQDIVHNNHVTCYDDLISILDKLASSSRTTKLWVDVLIKAVLIMMTYVRAEREGDWPLHLSAVKQMMPYFLRQDTSIMQDMDYTI